MKCWVKGYTQNLSKGESKIKTNVISVQLSHVKVTILLPLWLIQETNAWIQGGDVREISNEASTSAPPHATIKWKVIQRPSIINHQRLPSPCFSVTGSRTWRCISQTWKIYFSKFSWRCISNMKIYFEHFRVLSNVRSINYHEDANPTGMAWKLTLGQNYRNMMCPRMAFHSWQFQHMKENVHLLPHCTCREFIVSWVSLFTYLQFPDDNCPPREWLRWSYRPNTIYLKKMGMMMQWENSLEN